MQPRPEHVNVHVAFVPHTWLQPPPEHVNEHEAPAPQVCSQPPPLQLALHDWPAGHSWWQDPLLHPAPPVELVGVCRTPTRLSPSGEVVVTEQAARARTANAKESERDALCMAQTGASPVHALDRGVFGLCWRSPRPP